MKTHVFKYTLILTLSTTFGLPSLWAAEKYVCENHQHKILIFISSRTVTAAYNQQPFLAETDYVHILEKSSNKTFKYSPILYSVDGGGKARFQTIGYGGFQFWMDNNVVLDLYYSHGGASRSHYDLMGYFIGGYLENESEEENEADKKTIATNCQRVSL